MLNCRSGSAIVKQEGKRLIIIVAVAVLLVPGLVQLAFRTKAFPPFLEAEWTAGEFLD